MPTKNIDMSGIVSLATSQRIGDDEYYETIRSFQWEGMAQDLANDLRAETSKRTPASVANRRLFKKDLTLNQEIKRKTLLWIIGRMTRNTTN